MKSPKNLSLDPKPFEVLRSPLIQLSQFAFALVCKSPTSLWKFGKVPPNALLKDGKIHSQVIIIIIFDYLTIQFECTKQECNICI